MSLNIHLYPNYRHTNVQSYINKESVVKFMIQTIHIKALSKYFKTL